MTVRTRGVLVMLGLMNPAIAGVHHKLAERRERSAEKFLRAIEETFVQGRVFLAAKRGELFEL